MGVEESALHAGREPRLFFNKRYIGTLGSDEPTVRELLADGRSRIQLCLLHEVETVRNAIRWILLSMEERGARLQTIAVQSQERRWGTLPVRIKFRPYPALNGEKRTEVIECNLFLPEHKILSGR